MLDYLYSIINCCKTFQTCNIYFLFQVVEAKASFSMSVRLYELCVFAILIPFVLLRNLRILAPFSALANILTIVGLVITLLHCFQGLQPASSLPAFNSWRTLPLYFGIAIYAFEGIGVVSWFVLCLPKVLKS